MQILGSTTYRNRDKISPMVIPLSLAGVLVGTAALRNDRLERFCCRKDKNTLFTETHRTEVSFAQVR